MLYVYKNNVYNIEGCVLRCNFSVLLVVLTTVVCQVDDNVTRHLDSELSAADWDIMVLHYLGLDHIGHLEGPKSPKVGPKLQEMDKVAKEIHTRLLHWV
ncbi:hypothetical protein PR048_026510 [Dryococelus australis]|uniref:Uncharacterized protein n=1 Tax=Dryococelus australis TaxID=614101 RepID=A0ABQ9GLK7_9NEOP|nr:hypothetical protein PR048_026510 [Dryococelus australis]